MRIPKGGIAFFDSGIGGLTVLAACEKYFEEGVFYYYGDNTHAPYGNLPPEKIRKYVLKVFKKFRRLNVQAAVVACNTVTAVCVEELRQRYSFPIIGAEPAVCTAAEKGGEVFVLTTRATFESDRFRKLCERASKKFPNAKISPMACDGLAGEIESHLSEKDHDYTSLLPKGEPTAVVLGCTHYIYIEEQIKAYYGCEIYHGNDGMARRLCALLREEEEKNRDDRPPLKKRWSFLGILTTFFPCFTSNGKKKTETNKSLPLNCSEPAENQKKLKIVFLGKKGKNNQKIYKKTYVRDFFG